jgi:hypothetical protein
MMIHVPFLPAGQEGIQALADSQVILDIYTSYYKQE